MPFHAERRASTRPPVYTVTRVVHPLSNCSTPRTLVYRLRPGTPTSPKRDRLPLLPSGPGGVHGLLPRRTQPSTPFDADFQSDRTPSRGNSTPL